MSVIRWKSPGFIILPEAHDNPALVRSLSYKDSSVEYQMRRLRQNARRWKMNREDIQLRLDALKEQANKVLVWLDDDGNTVTYAGFWKRLSAEFGWGVELPKEWQDDDFDLIPWNRKPFDPREYQDKGVNSFLENPHSAIELPTGSGKSLVIVTLIKKRFTNKIVVVTPLKEVTNQLREDLEDAFGKKYVGQYGGGRKNYTKRVTVSTASSLASLARTLANEATPEKKREEAQKIWDELSLCDQLIFDESHTVPAETFEDVCVNGVARNAKFRCFLSATQTRSDGSNLLLEGITGPVLFRKSFQELVGEGFLKRVDPCIVRAQCYKSPTSDPKEEQRQNLYRNPHVAKAAATLAEKCVNLAGRQTVILIEEYSQFVLLRNFMNIPFEFAHGTLTSVNKETVPPEFWDSDTKAMVQRFNEGKTKCLIGTTAISTGVDIRPTGALIYIQGGKSEIKVKQGVGRGTRPVAHKNLLVFDFDVIGSPILESHCRLRKGIYAELSGSEVKTI